MKAEVYWIAGPWRGRLAIIPRPRGADWLDDEVRAWNRAGIGMVVSLLERDEAAQLGLANEKESVAAHHLTFIGFPIPDRGVPAPGDEALSLIATIRSGLDRGTNVALHCRQSVGRSGLIAAAVLSESGATVDQAIDSVTQARGVEIPETAEQLDWLHKLHAGREAFSL